VNRCTEIELLLERACFLESTNPIQAGSEIRTLCRAAVVLLSSHLEGYVKDLGELALDRLVAKAVPRSKIAATFFYTLSSEFVKGIKDTEDHEKLADKIFEFLSSDSPLWSRQGPFPNPLDPARFSSSFQSPSVDKIAKFFRRFGYKTYTRDLGAHLKADYATVINCVGDLINTRNNIAHGNLSASRTPTDVRNTLSTIRAFVDATDSVFASWCAKNLCAIR
jgi:hypothetical protein